MIWFYNEKGKNQQRKEKNQPPDANAVAWTNASACAYANNFLVSALFKQVYNTHVFSQQSIQFAFGACLIW